MRVFEERNKAMTGRTIKTLIASLMLGTMACCCVSLNQTQTRATTLPDKQMSDPGRATSAERSSLIIRIKRGAESKAL